jgi:hypothetical protein
MSTIFFTSCLTTQFVLLISNGNFPSIPENAFDFGRNAYSDFSAGWYNGVAPGIVQAQFIVSMTPWMENGAYICI